MENSVVSHVVLFLLGLIVGVVIMLSKKKVYKKVKGSGGTDNGSYPPDEETNQ